MDVSLLYFDDCPNWEETDRILRVLAREFGFQIVLGTVDTTEEAERVGFRGSPTVLIDGVDPFADGDAPVGLSCRRYRTPDGMKGSPTEAMLREAFAGPDGE